MVRVDKRRRLRKGPRRRIAAFPAKGGAVELILNIVIAVMRPFSRRAEPGRHGVVLLPAVEVPGVEYEGIVLSAEVEVVVVICFHMRKHTMLAQRLRQGVVIRLQAAQVVLNQLYNYTQMEDTFSVIMLALVKNQKQPQILTLREILDHYIAFQREIIERRTIYDLKKARERAHILEGLKIACDNIDEVIRIIRTSYNDAKERLMERFELSEVQAQAILDMRLGRLQGLEVEKIVEELQRIHARIKELEEILASDELKYDIIKKELRELSARFGDERRTAIAPAQGSAHAGGA